MSQTETLMVLALGAALMTMLFLLFGRVIWGLSVAAAARRRERKAPVEVLELQAERDRMRAEHALMARKLDLRVDEMKVRMAEQMAEVSRSRNRVQNLLQDLANKDEVINLKERANGALLTQMELLRTELEAAHQTIDKLNASAASSGGQIQRFESLFRNFSSGQNSNSADAANSQAEAAATMEEPVLQAAGGETALRRSLNEVRSLATEMATQHEALQPFAAPEPANAVSSASEGSHVPASEPIVQDQAETASAQKPAEPAQASGDPADKGEANVISLAQRIRALQRSVAE